MNAKQITEEIKSAMLRLESGYPQRSFLYYDKSKHENSEILKQIREIIHSFLTKSVWLQADRSKNISDIFINALQENGCSLPGRKNHSCLEWGAVDLADLFEAIGTQAQDSGDCFCIFLENLHCMRRADIQAFCSAIARVNRLNLPIITFITALPSITARIGRACSYAERLFIYHQVC